MTNPQVSFVIPLYNEEKTFHNLVKRILKVAENSKVTFEFVLVDDGSTDNTAMLMQQVALSNSSFHCIFLSRNFGHQLALTAGLAAATGTEAIMILDGDLQDPPELFEEFYEQFKNGYDIVYAIRKKRKENLFKRSAYFLFYRILQKISYINIPLDSGDFCLISRRALNVLNQMPEESRYLRGMRSWIGFKQLGLEYERDQRFAGESKYSFSRLFKLALNGIFNFSEVPIKFIINMGLLAVIVSSIYFIITLIRKFVYHDVPTGFTALLFTNILFGGVQLISIGVIGEYILRIFFQVKQRPLFIIKSRIYNKEYQDDQIHSRSTAY